MVLPVHGLVIIVKIFNDKFGQITSKLYYEIVGRDITAIKHKSVVVIVVVGFKHRHSNYIPTVSF